MPGRTTGVDLTTGFVQDRATRIDIPAARSDHNGNRGITVATDQRSARTRARPDVTLQRIGKEAILHDARNGRAHVINASAARVWDLCDGREFNELLRDFAESYGMAPDELRHDVEEVLAGFRGLDLLEPPDSTA